MNPDEGAYLGMNYYEGMSRSELEEHIFLDHQHEIEELVANRYHITSAINTLIDDHDPTDHEHGERGEG